MDKIGGFMVGAPTESIAILHESGWMNGGIFLMWLQYFKQHVQPTKENPVLLILDGHSKHSATVGSCLDNKSGVYGQ